MKIISQNSITTKFRMLKELVLCKSNGGVVAVWSKRFDSLLRICTVSEIRVDEDEADIIVVLRESRISTSRPDDFTLYMSEIDQINTFSNISA
jgi:hypothetical protein